IAGSDGMIRIFLPGGATIQDLMLAGPRRPPAAVGGAGGPILTAQRLGAGPILLGPVGAAGTPLAPVAEESALLAGRRCLMGQINGQDAAQLRDWLAFHAQAHGADGAVVLVRDPPPRADDLARGRGPGDAPSERALLNAPDAPGRRPAPALPAPWTSPLGAVAMSELLRWRFLDRAEGVASVDVSDLILPETGASVFERARATVAGVVALIGERAYPWELPEGAAPRHADHICVAADARTGHSRWCVAPEIAGPAAIWRASQILRTRGRVADNMAFRRCMALRHDGDQPLITRKRLVEDPALVALIEGGTLAAARAEGPRRMPAPPRPARKEAPLTPREGPEAAYLRSRELVIPVKGVEPDALRDTFGAARSGGRVHQAVDIMAKKGTPVLAADDGYVLRVGRN
ncbi:MAG: M23 family metallopeptidase, partial [Gemmobacter sp.]